MRRNINDVINSLPLPKNISYQIIINLLILKTLSKKEIYANLGFKSLWNNLVNLSMNERKEYFIYSYLPTLQSRKEFDSNLSLVFKNFHIPFLNINNIDDFSKLIDLVDWLEDEEITEFISDMEHDLRLEYIKTLDIEIQKNIIRLLEIKHSDRVLDLNLESSNFLSLLSNDAWNNEGFIQSHHSLSIRFLELLLNDNTHVQLVLNNPLVEYNYKFNDKYDIVFAIPPFGQRLSREDVDFYFPIQSSISHNVYIQKALNSLKYDGKCAIVVPDSFLNQSNKETDNVRKYIFDRLVSIINLGSVFKPYSGISVSLLLLKNDNFNNEILMANFQDNKKFPINDFSEFTERFVACEYNFSNLDLYDIRNTILVSKEKIQKNNFILDFKRYKPLEEIITSVQNPRDLLQDIQNNAKSLIESVSSIRNHLNKLVHAVNDVHSFKLSELSSIKLGKPLPKDNIQNGEIPYVNISDITRCNTDYIDSSEVMISEEFAYENNLTIVEKNSILLSVRGTIGKVILTGHKIAISPTLVAIEVNTNRVNPYFMYQWFLNKKEYLEVNAIGAAQKSLSTIFLKELKIDLPPKEIQDEFEIYKHDLDNIKSTLAILLDENQNLSKSIFNQFY